MKHLDLFSGIGGFALAAQWAGFETVAFCEIEEYPREVLKKNFPGVPIHEDVRKLDGREYAAIDLITGGYPCQPFSHAGKRNGHEDDRHLCPEMFRIIKQARPTWVVAENVAGHISMGLDQVLSDLEGEDYSARPVVIPACAIDAPHRRDRVWIIANSNQVNSRQGSSEQPEREKPCGVRKRILANAQGPDDWSSYSGENERQEQESGNCCGQRNVANTTSQFAGHGNNDDESLLRSRPKKRETRGTVRPEKWWPTEPRVGRVANGIPSRVDRVKGLGNAIVPKVAYQILQCLRAH